MANEAACAERFVVEVLSYCQGFSSISLFVILDRASRDQTLELLRQLAEQEPRLTVVWAPENRSVVDAYLRGYREALAADCDWILEIDAGYSHQPRDIPQFFDRLDLGCDCVFGTRFTRAGQHTESSFFRYTLSRFGGMLVNLLLGTRLSDMTSGFEAFTQESLRLVLHKGIHSKGHFFQSEIKTHCRNLNVAEVPISYRAASPGVNQKVIQDALLNLSRLFWARLRGRLG